MSFPRYPEYKDSGIEWLGEVPAHWVTRPLKYVTALRSGGTPSKDNLDFWDGSIPWASAKDLKRESLRDTEDHITDAAIEAGAAELVPAGAVLVVVRGMILARTFPVSVTAVPMAINQDLKALVPFRDMRSAYLARALHAATEESTRRIDEAGHGTKVLRMDAWTSLPLLVPPLDEQDAISAFLDREAAKIDALIAEQERLIELLKEKRQAVISHAVTKGLDPDVPMKDSGVEWLGEVPTHWESWKLSHAFESIGSGTTPTSSEERWYEDGAFPWVTTGELRETVILETLKSVTQKALVRFPALRLHPAGSLVIAMYGATIGRLGILGVPATTNQACCVLAAPKALNVRFVFHWISAFRRMLVDLYATGGGQPNINQETISGLRIPAPDLVEQAAIASFADTETARINGLIGQVEAAAILLRERRAALISAAVTGQINVSSEYRHVSSTDDGTTSPQRRDL